MNLVRSISGPGRLAFAAAACLLALAPALAQPVSFTTGPAGLIDDPTVPRVLDPVTGLNRAGTGKVLAADLTRSGRADVVVGPNLDGLLPTVAIPVRVLRSAGGGTFSDATRQLFGAGALPQTVWTTAISAVDFNRDGKLDLFLADSGNDRYPTTGATNVLLESTAAGTYVDRSATLPSLPDYSHSAASGDVDGDGIPDIYVGNIVPPQPGTCPYLLMRKSDGTSVRVSSTLPATIADCTEQYTAAHLVDVDNDGHADLVLGKWLANSAASIVLPNDGHGDFTTRPRVALPGKRVRRRHGGAGDHAHRRERRRTSGPPARQHGELRRRRDPAADQPGQRNLRRRDGARAWVRARPFSPVTTGTSCPWPTSTATAGRTSWPRATGEPPAPPRTSHGSTTATAPSRRSR